MPETVPTLTTTCFVGRAEALQQLAAALERNRLVAVVGPPGAGKTRLAAEYVATPRAPAPVWWVDLSSSDDIDGLLAVVAATLGVNFEGDDSAVIGEALAGHAAGLLVLDNGEQRAERGTTAATVQRHQAFFCAPATTWSAAASGRVSNLMPIARDAAPAIIDDTTV